MKKIGLLLSFLICCTILTGCFENKEETHINANVSKQSYGDIFKSDLTPLAIYSGYRFSGEIQKGGESFFTKKHPWLLSVYSGKDNNYLYEITYSLSDNPMREGDSSIPPITISFLSDTLIYSRDIIENHSAGALEIQKSDFLHILDNSIRIGEVPHSSGVIDVRCINNNRERCTNREEKDWQCAEFPSGTGELNLRGMPDYGLPTISYHYVNHLSGNVYWSPWSYTYPNDYDLAKDNCYIEIGKASDFPELPFHLGRGFEDAILALTKEKKVGTSCRDMPDRISHDYNIKLMNDKLICDIGINREVKLVEVSMPASWLE